MFGRKILTLMLAGVLFTMTVPTASAETVVRDYDLAFGTATSGGGVNTYDPALTWPICSEGWYTGGEDSEEPWGTVNTGWNAAFGAACPLVAEDEEGFNIGVGGFDTTAGSVYTQAIASTSDDNFDATYVAGCVKEEENKDNNFCDVHATGCGSITVIPGFLFGGDDGDWDKRLGIFIYTAALDVDTFEPCFGSSGDVTAVFS